jgi:hypothetical protein
MRRTLPIFFLLVTASASADVVVDVQPGPGTDFAAALGISEQDLEARLRTEIEELFNIAAPDEYVVQIANAQGFSTKGIGVDYASNIENAVFGVAANLSVAVDSDTISSESSSRPVGGIAPQLTIMAGINLHGLNLPGLTLYGNFFTRSFSYRDFDATLRNAGVHLQINLFRPKPSKEDKVVKWGGFDLTTGVEWAYFKVGLDTTLDTEFEVDGSGGQSATILMNSVGEYTLTSSAFSVPLELTTTLRFLVVASIYFGVGTDFQVGSGEVAINLNGTIRGIDPDSGDEVDLGTAVIRANEEGKPSPARFRALVGAQINLWKFRIFAQANYRPLAAFGVSAGLRVAW